MNNTIDTLENLYTKETYYQKYGKDVIISIFIIYLFLAISFYFHTLNHIPNIKANWNQNKCNPIYMPFAGVVLNNPKKTNLEQVDENFSQCIQNILVSIINVFVEPFLFALTVIIDAVEGTFGSFNTLRALFDAIRKDISELTNNIEKKILYSNAPILRQTVLMKNSIQVTTGILTTALYELFGSFLALKSFGGSIIQLIDEVILIPMAILIAVLWALYFALVSNPFTAIFAGVAYASAFATQLTYIAILIPLLIIQFALVDILHIAKVQIQGP